MAMVGVETPERDVVQGCQVALHDAGWVHWRSQSGSFRTVGGGWFRTGVVGLADLCAIIPPCGRLLMVECKRESGRLSVAQSRFLDVAAKQGAFCVVIRDPDDLKWVISRLKANPDLKPEDL